MRLQVSIEVIEAARTGDAADVERLLEAVWPGAYRLARAIVTQRQAAEDAAQEACVTMFRSIRSLRSSAAFGAWFYRIVVREALKQKKAQTFPAQFDDVAYADDALDTLDLWRALAALPPGQRAAVVLHYFEGLSGAETAAVLGIPHATLRFRLMTARRRLQRLLQDTGVSTQSKGELYAL